LKEVRSVGSYTSSPPGEPHREGGGAEGAVVFYSIRGEQDTFFEVLDDDLNIVGALVLQNFVDAFKEQKNA
jgi:2,4'-dihydroxyacetophenone dioxygenase